VAKRPIEIDCEEVWRHVSNYLDKQVRPDFRATLEAHFKSCAHCSAILDGTRNTVTLVGDGRAFELPARTRHKLYGKLEEYLQSRGDRRR